MKRILGALFVVIVSVSPALTWASDSRVGLRFGANWSTLSGPADPAGAPTLQSGTSFDGLGIVGGISSGIGLVDFSEQLKLALGLDLLISTHSVSSIADSPSTEQSREVELTTIILRAPFIGHLEYQTRSFDLRIGLGPALLLGLSSGATVTQDNIPGDVEPLFTTPVTHVGIEFGLGMSWNLSENYAIPLDLRFTYDPAVPSTTRERFDNFQSNDEPGQYQVGLDYQFLLMIGVDYRLNLRGDS